MHSMNGAAYFTKAVSYERKMFMKLTTGRNKTGRQRSSGAMLQNFFVRNLWISVISWSVCPWQAFPAKSNVCGEARSLP
jgi:hypothetical protein